MGNRARKLVDAVVPMCQHLSARGPCPPLRHRNQRYCAVQRPPNTALADNPDVAEFAATSPVLAPRSRLRCRERHELSFPAHRR